MGRILVVSFPLSKRSGAMAFDRASNETLPPLRSSDWGARPPRAHFEAPFASKLGDCEVNDFN
jgi:hypothetical protein